MAKIFRIRLGEHRSPMPEASGEDFDDVGAEKIAKPGRDGAANIKPQSFELGLLRPGRRRAPLAVLAPRRATLLAETQNPGAQTIPSKNEAL